MGSCNLAAAGQDVEYDGPPAVTQAGGVNYSYDANGNQISGDGRTLEYNSFHKPTRIEKGDHTTFAYGPSRGRYKRTD